MATLRVPLLTTFATVHCSSSSPCYHTLTHVLIGNAFCRLCCLIGCYRTPLFQVRLGILGAPLRARYYGLCILDVAWLQHFVCRCRLRRIELLLSSCIEFGLLRKG